MENMDYSALRTQLVERRDRLENSIRLTDNAALLVNLLQEVDSALERMHNGTYGLCEVCHDPIEPDRLRVDPLLRVCLDHLDLVQQKNLEQDLEMAARIQQKLLPRRDIVLTGWDAAWHYKPAGPVSGDYCDLIVPENKGHLQFMTGDVSGKGIAASMLMTNLHGLFHSLVSFNIPVTELMGQANRLFCQSTLASHYATFVYGYAGENGEMEICNAGHCPPILVSTSGIRHFKPTGLPLGLICEGKYQSSLIKFASGDSLVLYTDGLSETFRGEEQYGDERVAESAVRHSASSASEMIAGMLADFSVFLNKSSQSDDLTLMVIRRL